MEDEIHELRHRVADLGIALDLVYQQLAPRVWFKNAFMYTGVRKRLLPWIGSDGNHFGAVWRNTLVIPVFGLFFIVIGGKWRWDDI